MGIFEVLTIVFVVLKLLGVIAWSWWVVFIPLYVSVGVPLVLIVLMAVSSYKAKRDIEQLYGGKTEKVGVLNGGSNVISGIGRSY